ncbi:MAG: methyltransferase RsmF C-terminal domain-like protein, partial [Chitinophagaceae bacterium]
MKLPGTFISSLEGLEGFDKEAFEKVHESGDQITSIRINPFKSSSIINNDWTPGDPAQPSIRTTRIPWSRLGYYLHERPSFTFDPLFHAGCYYVQEASSMFLEQALLQTMDLTKPVKVLDLAAAPGGKSTHIQSLISKESL